MEPSVTSITFQPILSCRFMNIEKPWHHGHSACSGESTLGSRTCTPKSGVGVARVGLNLHACRIHDRLLVAFYCFCNPREIRTTAGFSAIPVSGGPLRTLEPAKDSPCPKDGVKSPRRQQPYAILWTRVKNTYRLRSQRRCGDRGEVPVSSSSSAFEIRYVIPMPRRDTLGRLPVHI